MKLALLLGILVPFGLVSGQTIQIDSVSKTNLCVGETIKIYYTATGPFAADNAFAVQLSDANGSFAHFTNFGNSTSTSDSISVPMGGAGDNWRIRGIATDPYTISAGTSPGLHVFTFPSPKPVTDLRWTSLGQTGFVGQQIQFSDASAEPAGSTDLWSLGSDATIVKLVNNAPLVTYLSTGTKSGSVFVTNGAGCSTTANFEVTILTCNPQISDSAHIVKATESGSYKYVWVKAGGNYTATNETMQTVFVEPGGSLVTAFRSVGIYYLRDGSSFTPLQSPQGSAMIILTSPISFGGWDSYNTDTITCGNLHFDYSQVGGVNSGVEIPEAPFEVENTMNHFRVNSPGEIHADLYDILGISRLSAIENDALDLDLSSLADGVYVVSASSGKYHELRKILVVH